jgi:hypothetical protein
MEVRIPAVPFPERVFLKEKVIRKRVSYFGAEKLENKRLCGVVLLNLEKHFVGFVHKFVDDDWRANVLLFSEPISHVCLGLV